MDGRKRPSKRRFWRLVAVLAVASVLVAGFGPALLSIDPLRSLMIARATDGLPISVSVESLSLGWTRPVVVRGLSIVDDRGQTILTAESVSSQRSFWSLVTNRSHVGRIGVRRPSVTMAFSESGSNLESLVADLMSRSSGGAAAGEGVIEITEGRVHFRDQHTGQEFQAEELGGEVAWNGRSATTVDVEGRLGTPAEMGRVRVRMAWADSSGIEINGQIERVPLEVGDPLVRRGLAAWRATGSVSGDAIYRRGRGAAHRLQIQKFSGERISIHGLEADFHSERVAIAGACEWSDRDYRFDGLSITGDVGQFTATGVVPRHAESSPASSIAALSNWLDQRQPFDIRGDIDLSAIARVFPTRVRLREGLELTRGRVVAALQGRAVGDRYEMNGSLEATDLVANSRGVPVEWLHPLKLDVGISHSSAGFEVTRCLCESEFMDARISGNARAATLTAGIQLDALMAQAAQFFDLEPLQLAGTLTAQADWTCSEQGAYALGGDITADRFVCVRSGVGTWSEPQLNLSFEVAGTRDISAERLSVERGELRLKSGQDQLDVRLRQAVASVSAASAWPIAVELSGEARTWMARSAVVGSPAIDLSGRMESRAELTVSRDVIEVHSGLLNADDVRLESAHRLIAEPILEVQLSGRYERPRRRWTSDEFVLRSSTLALRAAGVEVSLAPGAGAFQGDVAFRGDVGRLSAWLLSRATLENERWGGELTGHVRAVHQSGTTAVEADAELANIQFARRAPADPATFGPANHAAAWDSVWVGRTLGLSGSAEYHGPSATLKLNQVVAGTSRSKVSASGTLETRGDGRVSLSGNCDYDLAQLDRFVKLLLGDQVRITGAGSEAFRINGPIAGALSRSGPWPDDLTADAAVAWEAADVYGFSIGPGRIAARLEAGEIRTEPQVLSVSGGRLHVHPVIRFSESPIQLSQGAGPLVERVRMTPEMCRNWLKFAAPLVANTSEVAGECSFTLEDARVPFGRADQAHVRGTLEIHSAQAGPGPLGRELVWLAATVPAIMSGRPLLSMDRISPRWVEMPPQRVPIVMAGGRVHHQDLVWVIDRTVIRTRGSVGLDQSLALVASVDIRPEWIRDERLRTSLAGQTIDVPIGGTFDTPRLDRRALDQLAAKFIGGAAQKLLEQEINRGLQRLFDK